MPTRRLLQQYAIAISIISVFFNTAEGAISVVFGAESSSHALVFFGLQSAVEVISDVLVTWRFVSVSKSGDELESFVKTHPQIIRIERIATITIGALLLSLTFAAIGTSAVSLKAHDHPSTTLPAILIASVSTGITLFLYLAKRYLARALDSSALHGEALCALCCMQLSVVLLIGSLVYRVWKGGWWLDAATAIAISLLFGWEGIKAIRWARNKDFDGGCCGDCRSMDKDAPTPACATTSTEAGKPEISETERSSCSSCTRCCAGSKKVEPVSEEQV